jgi:hypothetical protein
VLGPLDEKTISKGITKSAQPKEAKIWAIGHWYVRV